MRVFVIVALVLLSVFFVSTSVHASVSESQTSLFHDAAERNRLPENLLLAIAWQESNWRQNVVSRGGGIGIMQIMPRTAAALNIQTHAHYNPYKLADNITLGAMYLHSLWREFHGNLMKVISAYNEGDWNVAHRGIFNWSYVNHVLVLMHRFQFDTE